MPSSRSDLRALGSWIGHFQEQRTRFSKLQLALPAGLGPWNQQIDRRHGHSCTQHCSVPRFDDLLDGALLAN
jgi:hypothetical protein